MAKYYPILIICICAAAICMIGVILLSSPSAPFSSDAEYTYTQIPDISGSPEQSTPNPTYSPTETPTPVPVMSTSIPTSLVSPTSLPTVSVSPVPEPSVTPSLTPTPEKTISPTPAPTLSALQVEGLSLLAGKWHGEQSIPFIITGIFYADCEKDFTAVLNGKVSFGTSENDFFLPVTWQYLGNTQFIATTGDGTPIPFTCDGKKLTLAINPKKNIAETYPDTNLQIELFRV